MIGKEKFDIYIKYSGEYDLLYERSANKKDRLLITGNEFADIDKLICNLKMLDNKSFLSIEFQAVKRNEIILLKTKMTDEVYQNILTNYQTLFSM